MKNRLDILINDVTDNKEVQKLVYLEKLFEDQKALKIYHRLVEHIFQDS